MAKNRSMSHWDVDDSIELYGIRNWGAGFFDVNEDGAVVICPQGPKGPQIPMTDVIAGLHERGYDMPVLLRVENILASRITRIHESFRRAIKTLGYGGEYRGVFPVKVNQQQQVVEKIVQAGAPYHHGLEVGSKGELMAALSLMRDHEACLVCNGYKDEEFFNLGLQAQRLGFNVFFVLEMPGELDVLLACADALNVRPNIGVRCKLATKATGHWTDSGGERSTFGLSPAQIEIGRAHV